MVRGKHCHSQWLLLETQYLCPHWASHAIALPPCYFLITSTPTSTHLHSAPPHTCMCGYTCTPPHAQTCSVHIHLYSTPYTWTHKHSHQDWMELHLSDTDRWHFLLRSEHWVPTQLIEHRTLYSLWNPRVALHTKFAVWRNWLSQLDVWVCTSSVESTYLKKS